MAALYQFGASVEPARVRDSGEHRHGYLAGTSRQGGRQAHAASQDQRGRSDFSATGTPLVIAQATEGVLENVVRAGEICDVVAVEKIGPVTA